MHIRESIYLAGLLHDIGKFYQRADSYGVKASACLSAETKNLISVLCPTNANDYTHKHALWTYQFFQDFAANFKQSGLSLEDLAILAAAHHKPNPADIRQVILQKADQLASATDRSKVAGDDSKNSNDNFKTTRLRSVFDFIKEPTKGNKGANSTYIPLQTLSLERSFVLRQTAANHQPSADEYKPLWERFTGEFRHALHKNPQDFLETTLNLLHKYTVAVPATTTDLPDVSLYDHSRVVAALAVCLYDWLGEHNNDKTLLMQAEQKPFLLLGGQISGIQNFIYNIIGTYAAKNLKGRSFYLELLCDDLVAYILKELELFSGNIIYNSGGNFYLLAPNTQKVIGKLKEIERHIQKQLFDKHKIDLAVILAVQEVSIEHLNKKNISQPWVALFDKLNNKKAQKHRLIIIDEFEHLFKPQGNFGKGSLTDPITGDEIEKGKEPSEETNDSEKIHFSPSTYEQIALGYHLKDAFAIAEMYKEEPYFEKYAQKQKYPNVCDPLEQAGSVYYLIDEEGLENIQKGFENRGDTLRRIIGINRFDIATVNFARMTDNKPAWSFKLYGGNSSPTVKVQDKRGNIETEVKTFSEMAGMPEKDRAYKDFQELKFKRLGVLRMDVDNLGRIFSEGFKGEETLARFASLSRQMDLFFKGYLNTIRESDDDFKNNLQILYAGGDDLFVVGRWDAVIRFAREVRESFRKFVNRDDITISGGIAIVPAKFPIGKAAIMAGEAEDDAKKFNSNAKNAVCLFNQPISWDREFAIVERLKDEMVSLRQHHDLSASFLQQLMRFQMVKNRDKTNAKYSDKADLSYVWNAAYAIGRYKERAKNNEAIKTFLETTQKALFAGDKHTDRDRYFDLYAIAARWAELELRSK